MGNTLDVTAGEYTVIQDKTGAVKVNRHGTLWKDCTGDGLVMALACEVETLRKQLKELKARKVLKDTPTIEI